MRDLDTYHLYVQAKTELEKLFNESGLDAQACLQILEPEMAHGFNEIRVQAEDLRNKGNIYDKCKEKQTSLFEGGVTEIHNQKPFQW